MMLAQTKAACLRVPLGPKLDLFYLTQSDFCTIHRTWPLDLFICASPNDLMAMPWTWTSSTLEPLRELTCSSLHEPLNTIFTRTEDEGYLEQDKFLYSCCTNDVF